MVRCCSVSCCRRNDYKHRFGFPKDPEIRAKWIEACNREDDFDPTSKALVCERHFTPEDFQRDLKNELLNLPQKIHLLPGAIPSLMLDGPPLPFFRNPSSEGGQRRKLKRKRGPAPEKIPTVVTIDEDVLAFYQQGADMDVDDDDVQVIDPATNNHWLEQIGLEPKGKNPSLFPSPSLAKPTRSGRQPHPVERIVVCPDVNTVRKSMKKKAKKKVASSANIASQFLISPKIVKKAVKKSVKKPPIRTYIVDRGVQTTFHDEMTYYNLSFQKKKVEMEYEIFELKQHIHGLEGVKNDLLIKNKTLTESLESKKTCTDSLRRENRRLNIVETENQTLRSQLENQKTVINMLKEALIKLKPKQGNCYQLVSGS